MLHRGGKLGSTENRQTAGWAPGQRPPQISPGGWAMEITKPLGQE